MNERKVGVRELRQNLTKYLRRVKRGERLEVIERGRPVAVLAPIADTESALERLISSGRVLPPTGDLRDVLPPKGHISKDVSDALEDVRADQPGLR